MVWMEVSHLVHSVLFNFRAKTANLATLWRIVRKPITFSNGTSVPAGTFLSAATAPYHTDEQQYKNPNTFDPWRFVDSSKTFVTTSVDYIPFGHGRHAW